VLIQKKFYSGHLIAILAFLVFSNHFLRFD